MAVTVPPYPPKDPLVDLTTGKLTSAWEKWFAQLSEVLTVNLPIPSSWEVLQGTFANNDPSAGYVSWTKTRIRVNGVKRSITPGNSNKKWIYWSSAQPTSFLGSDTFPTPSDSQVVLGLNSSGTLTQIWAAAYRSELDRVYKGLLETGEVNVDKVIEDSILADSVVTLKIKSENVVQDHFAEGAVVDQLDAGFQYLVGALTTDGAWHELDVSAVVPAGRTLVLLRVKVNATAGYAIYFRKHGSTSGPDSAVAAYKVNHSATDEYATIVVNCSTDRVIEYLGTSGSWTTLSLGIVNYW